jgi:hypothetical protein
LAQQKTNSDIALRGVASLARTDRSDNTTVKFLVRARRKKARKVHVAKLALRDVQRTIWYKRPKAARLSKTLQVKVGNAKTQKRIHGL